MTVKEILLILQSGLGLEGFVARNHAENDLQLHVPSVILVSFV